MCSFKLFAIEVSQLIDVSDSQKYYKIDKNKSLWLINQSNKFNGEQGVYSHPRFTIKVNNGVNKS